MGGKLSGRRFQLSLFNSIHKMASRICRGFRLRLPVTCFSSTMKMGATNSHSASVSGIANDFRLPVIVSPIRPAPAQVSISPVFAFSNDARSNQNAWERYCSVFVQVS